MERRNQNRQSFAVEPLEGRRMLAATPATVDVQEVEKDSMYAVFSNVDPTGSILTTIGVGATRDPVSGALSADASLAMINFATGEPIISCFGNDATITSMYIAPTLDSASLNATILTYDTTTGDWVPVTVNLQWTTTGSLIKEHDTTVDRSVPGTKVISIYDHDYRQATATGTVTSPGSSVSPLSGNLAPDPSYDAEIESVSDTVTTVMIPSPSASKALDVREGTASLAAEIFGTEAISVLN